MLEKVKEIIADKLSVEGVELTLETSFKDDLGADSLDLFDLITAFDEEFDLELSPDDDELESIATIGDVIELMKTKGAE